MKKVWHRSLTIAGALFLAGCTQENTYAPPPPPEVDVVEPVIENTEVFLEFPGRTQAISTMEIRARVRGFLQTRDFQPGQFVEKDQLLFTIEPEEFEAAVLTAQGTLDKAKADLELAKTNFERRSEAGKTGAVSKIEVLGAEAEMKAAMASVAIANAALNDAKRNLDYTKITALGPGRVSREQVDIGNLVGSSEPTLLTTVVQDDPLYVNFEVSERAVLPYLKNRPREDRENLDTTASQDAVRLVLSNGDEYPTKGNLDFLDNAADPQTGTFRARAKFDNPDGALASGLFVRLRIPESKENAVKVPRLAVQRDLGGSFVLVVGEGDIVERRVVVPTEFTVGDEIILEGRNDEKNSGVAAGERIVVSNLQRARAGIMVAPKTPGAEPVAKPEPEPKAPPEKAAEPPAPEKAPEAEGKKDA